ncbi:ArsA-related P-loop ATPase [Miltoncostaea marina]|uniref:ArsA-related P-loop ATPase n=1 Tax=Miltoncostaea marina TaxID=2843215 RepID=UPI001C3D7AF4|nr:ArsA-related P-loop ATPase [Miltoncostaea marina]
MTSPGARLRPDDASAGPPLAERRLRFVLGKGGAGKSTVAAALGLAAARAGARALVAEVAGQHQVSRLFRAADVGSERETELAPGLFGISIDAERATEEYLAGQLKIRPLVEVLTRSRAFHSFAAAAPGLPELVTVGKIWSLAIAIDRSTGRPVWDTVIVDCPATGHGIALLATAGNVEELAAGGPIRDQAARIQEVVTHPAATGVVIVALPEELAVTEAVEAAALLREHSLPVAATVLNGVRPVRFSLADAPALERVARGEGPVAGAARAALAHLAHQRADAAYRERLAEGVGVPVIALPRVIGRHMDIRALERLADGLEESVPVGAA